MDIQGKVAIITGGGSGLGEATALQLAAGGAKVVVVDLNADAAKDVAARAGGLGLSFDVADSDAAEAAIARIEAELGTPRILVNCAGVGTPAKILGRDGPLPLATFEKIVRINLVGSFNMLRLVAYAVSRNLEPGDGKQTQGVIINTASVAAFDGQIGQPAYAASKAGVVGLALPAARELAKIGVRVLTIAPGIFMTPMLKILPPEALDSLGASVPFPPRLGEPDEFAKLALHMIDNDMLNGEVVRIDGAIRMQPR
ncbi:SDR family NAD(P)-dependent oxidoreductase [Sphingobium terrigena]|uniref:SDR family NAD(P)-dependent oxidoreductase n=1 Tax=Sphingobium terrigena TaxID=2304063 RepID=A0A418YYB2_9SPHN|nr:SDR family NAD(P)-dependent oxidoreductase [Sphingobium terrigena]RJG57874.1 SDR family NAD(P)-dependent oxidoreductase [Sphingobium terrigena]